MRGALLLLAALLATPLRAEAPEAAPRPLGRQAAALSPAPLAPGAVPRPALRPEQGSSADEVSPPGPAPGPEAAPEALLMIVAAPLAPGRPRPRPGPADPVAAPSPAAPRAGSPHAPLLAVLPLARPAALPREAERPRAETARGSVCGIPAIRGESVAPVLGRGGCGISEPVRVRSVAGVALSEGALMDCATAEALLDWVERGVRPAIGGQGGGLARLEIMGHYSCRPRNNQSGARLSEHGRGHAVDIGAVILADGRRLGVLEDWPHPALRAMREAACGIFSTVLGPGSDRFHANHFHLDTARGRGPYCR